MTGFSAEHPQSPFTISRPVTHFPSEQLASEYPEESSRSLKSRSMSDRLEQSASFSGDSLPTPALPQGMSSQVSPWLSFWAYLLGHRLILPLFFKRVQVFGQAQLPALGPVILAPTHRSRWDALMLPYAAGRQATGRDLRFMVSADEMQGVQGWIISRLGGFAIDTHRPGVASLRHGIELLEKGEMMVVFPEGNIFRDPTAIEPLKPGLARLAMQAQINAPDVPVKIVPIAIRYSHPWVPWRSSVEIYIGVPLCVADYCQGHLKKDAKTLTAGLSNGLSSLIRSH